VLTSQAPCVGHVRREEGLFKSALAYISAKNDS
jgi:hypothetical protein